MQPDDGKVRFSLRSQNPDFPVIDIAHRFGGGGHMLAAGATAENVNLAAAAALLIQYASEVLIPDNNEQ
jgi:nanoRNase/pAp phosphatase (c-di-AMP/oligoRNAs hydrolase)